MENKRYYIYKHTFPNGKVYIGITNMKPSRRWRNGNGYRTQSYVFSAIMKYGWDNIDHEVLQIVNTRLEAEKIEIELITNVYHSNDRKYGYNIANGGCGKDSVSDESRRKMSLAKLGKTPWNKGIPFSEEAKRHMSEAHLGNKRTKESIEKQRRSMTGFRHSEQSKEIMRNKAIGNKNAKGCKRSDEFKKALSLRKKGITHSDKTKKHISELKKKQKWWTNGFIETMSEFAPDENWINGRLKKWKILHKQ